MSERASVNIELFGDAALLIRWPQRISPELSAQVQALAADVKQTPLPGVRETVPSYSSLAVLMEPRFAATEGAAEALSSALHKRLQELKMSERAAGRLITIPVCYGGADGPDLEEVAERTRLAADEVIALHSGAEYRVAMLGFLPGFPYLMGLDPRLAVGRKETPRVRVPAGSVAIGGSQTGVYPCDSPGGWQLIGRTQVGLFDADARPPALLAPGDRVRFRPICAEELPAARVQIE